MLFSDPKTFDEYLKRAARDPWIAVALVSAVMTLLFIVAVIFERDPMKRFAPISDTGKRAFAIATGLVVAGGICVAPLWSRNLRILVQRGRRTEGRIASYSPLNKGGARLVTVEYDGAINACK